MWCCYLEIFFFWPRLYMKYQLRQKCLKSLPSVTDHHNEYYLVNQQTKGIYFFRSQLGQTITVQWLTDLAFSHKISMTDTS
jgi:hypothetical protein